MWYTPQWGQFHGEDFWAASHSSNRGILENPKIDPSEPPGNPPWQAWKSNINGGLVHWENHRTIADLKKSRPCVSPIRSFASSRSPPWGKQTDDPNEYLESCDGLTGLRIFSWFLDIVYLWPIEASDFWPVEGMLQVASRPYSSWRHGPPGSVQLFAPNVQFRELVSLCFIVPSGNLTVCYWKWPFVVDFPIKNGWIFP